MYGLQLALQLIDGLVLAGDLIDELFTFGFFGAFPLFLFGSVPLNVEGSSFGLDRLLDNLAGCIFSVRAEVYFPSIIGAAGHVFGNAKGRCLADDELMENFEGDSDGSCSIGFSDGNGKCSRTFAFCKGR